MVDLGVNVVGTAREDDAASTLRAHFCKETLALGADVGLGAKLFTPCELCGGLGFLGRYSPFLTADVDEAVGCGLLAGEGDKGANVFYTAVADRLDVIFKVFGVGDDYGAVEFVVCARGFLMLVEHAGVENGFHALANEPFYVAVSKLCGIALGFRGNGLHAELVDFAAGIGREEHAEAETCKERCPERIVLIYVKDTGNADSAARCGLSRERLVVEESGALILKEVWCALPCSGVAERLFTTVARDMYATAGEFVDREHTVVLTTAATATGGRIFKREDVGDREHGGFFAAIVATCDQSRAERAHKTGDVGADHVYACDLFEGAENRLVIERTALNDDVITEVGGRCELNYLIKCVFDDRISKTGGDVRDLSSLLLRLLHVGVHKHGATCTEIHGIFGVEGGFGEIGGGSAEGVGEVLDKRAATRGAGLVEQDVIDGTVL